MTTKTRTRYLPLATAAAAMLLLAGCATPGPSTGAAPGPTQTVPFTRAAELLPTSTPAADCSFTTADGAPLIDTRTVLPGAHPAPARITESLRTAEWAAESAPVYAKTADRTFEQIGVMPATMPWDTDPTPAVVVTYSATCAMAEILLPARAALPSETDTPVAQVTGWVPTAALVPAMARPRVVTVSLSAGTLTVTDPEEGELLRLDSIVTGGDGEATPTGTGYIISEYTDAENQPWTGGETIQLLSLHSIERDSFAGNAGEIGVHFSTVDPSRGSAGCIRIQDQAGMQALDALTGPGDLVEVVA